MKTHNFLKKTARPKNRLLATEVASSSTDPLFYSAMQVLPNPDATLRKLGKAQDAYDAIGYDAHVMGEIRSQYGSLLKHEWQIIAGGDSAADVAALELCLKIFKRAPAENYSWSNLIWNTFSAVHKGYSVSEVVWQREDNYMVPCKIMDKPNRRFAFSHAHELRLLTKANQTDGEPVDPYKFLLTRHMPNHDNPYGFAVFSACFWPYTFKHNGYRWFSKFMQRFGQPSAVGRYPMGTDKKKQAEFLAALEQMIEDRAIVIPEGEAVTLLEAKVGAHNPHDSFINLCNRELSKALTSQTLGSEVTEAGSRSTGEVQQDRQNDNSEADREMIQRTMQQIIDWICELNFPTAVPPLWQWYDEKQVSSEEVSILKESASLVPIKTDEIYEKLQLTKPQDGDEVTFLDSPPPTDPDNSNIDFSRNGSIHHFTQENDQLSDLGDQGVTASKPAINRMLSSIFKFSSKAKDLDDFDSGLVDLLDDVDVRELESALQNTKVIARVKGIDDA